MEKKYRRITAVILILIMVLSLGIGTKTVKVSAALWTLDMDRETGIAQIQEYIPDYNFAQAVYDSLRDADYMGDGVLSVKEVLETFDGDIMADGFKSIPVYTVRAWKVTTNGEIEQIEEEFENREDAEVFYLMLVDTQEYQYLNKRIENGEKKLNEQKDENDLIHDITGIQWLRKVNSIDISYNKISDLSVLDINYLKTLEGAAYNGEKWFGSAGHNLYIDFRGNPIRKYPGTAGGRLNWPRLESAEFQLPIEPYVIVKEDEADKAFDLDIRIPLIERDGERIDIKENGCKISGSDIDGISIDENRITNEIAPLMGITYSGNILIGIESADTSAIGSYVVSESDLSTIGASTLKFLFNQSVRIYTSVKTIPSEVNANITLEKTMADAGRPVYVKGAVYRLYKAHIVEGSYVKGDLYSDTYYTTDTNGKITIEGTLPAGDYCLVEEEAPENYILDDTPIGFSLGGTVSLTGGTAQLTTADGNLMEAALNVTYIDRFSPDVSLEVMPKEGQRIGKIVLTYFDREQQDYKTLEFLGESAVFDAQNFINTNKGNEEGPGLIDGSVTIQAVFDAAVDLRAENPYKTGDLKVSKRVSGNGASRTKDFNFTVTLGELPDGTAANGEYGEMIFTNGVANFTLHDGESRMASNLPVGTTYKVTEEETDGYTTASIGEAGAIIADEVAAAEFTNTIIPGNLLVTKKVEGEGGDTAKDFRFTVTLGELSDGRKVTGEYGEMTFTEGVAEFTLHDGESRMAEGLPVGINYTVTEEEAQGYRTASANEEGTILADTTIKAEFTNTIIPGKLLVTKKVEGEGGDTAKDFRFTVTLGELSDGRKVTGEYGEMTFTEGVAEFTLHDGESRMAEELPVGISYTVTEEEAGDYRTVSTDEAGIILSDTIITVNFINYKKEEEPSTTKKPDTPEEPSTQESPSEPQKPGMPENPSISNKQDSTDNKITQHTQKGPNTGDETNGLVLILLSGISMISISVLCFCRKKEQNNS